MVNYKEKGLQVFFVPQSAHSRVEVGRGGGGGGGGMRIASTLNTYHSCETHKPVFPVEKITLI